MACITQHTGPNNGGPIGMQSSRFWWLLLDVLMGLILKVSSKELCLKSKANNVKFKKQIEKIKLAQGLLE